MKKIFLFMAVSLALGGLTACEQHTDEFDNSPKVGSVLLSNGTVVSPYGLKTNSLPAVGVIFYAAKDTVLIVGTKELGCYAYADSLGSISGVTNDFTSLCGTENTAAIIASGVSSPAVNAVCGYSSYLSSWALPSAGEQCATIIYQFHHLMEILDIGLSVAMHQLSQKVMWCIARIGQLLPRKRPTL